MKTDYQLLGAIALVGSAGMIMALIGWGPLIGFAIGRRRHSPGRHSSSLRGLTQNRF